MDAFICGLAIGSAVAFITTVLITAADLAEKDDEITRLKNKLEEREK